MDILMILKEKSRWNQAFFCILRHAGACAAPLNQGHLAQASAGKILEKIQVCNRAFV
ncbi:hypothetical protein ACFLU6_10555 [Acidobacteriota bacterium]